MICSLHKNKDKYEDIHLPLSVGLVNNHAKLLYVYNLHVYWVLGWGKMCKL